MERHGHFFHCLYQNLDLALFGQSGRRADYFLAGRFFRGATDQTVVAGQNPFAPAREFGPALLHAFVPTAVPAQNAAAVGTKPHRLAATLLLESTLEQVGTVPAFGGDRLDGSPSLAGWRRVAGTIAGVPGRDLHLFRGERLFGGEA